MKRKILLSIISTFCLNAHAEWSMSALGGVNIFTTKVRGDALYAYGPTGSPYYQYPADMTHDNFAGGLTLRYLYSLYPCIAFGGEGAYIFLTQNTSRLRSNSLTPEPTDVENIKSKSNGTLLLDFVLNFKVSPTMNLNFFVGPAWLSTYYKDNDFADGFVRDTTNGYQLTADIGASTEWQFYKNWVAGMRFDYIFDTRNQNISRIGSLGTALNENTYASSRVAIASATLRYVLN